MDQSESRFVQHEPCPKCGSNDNLARYDDGHAYCFGCFHYEHPEGREGSDYQPDTQLVSSTPQPLTKRRISRETCVKFGYGVGQMNGEAVQVANYFDNQGRPLAQKIRFANKDFRIVGSGKRDLPLWGMHLWRDSGKMVVVTEGEIDAMSVSQAQGNKWPVVSVPTGAAGAVKSVKQSLKWLEGFDTVVFMFDNDEPGKKAAAECAILLAPGKAKIASLPVKDASDMLQQSREKELISCIWDAKVFRPDGVILGQELLDKVLENPEDTGVLYPWNGLNMMTRGIRLGEVVVVTSGTGQGKSTICRQLAHYLMGLGHTVGIVALEENVGRTARLLVALELGVPTHLWESKGVTDIEKTMAFNSTLGTGRCVLYDHWGSIDSNSLLNNIRYMVRGCGCTHVFLDHLSIVVSGMGEGDERRMIDNTMTKLRSLVEELKFSLFIVSHLKRPMGDQSHEEGADVSLSHIRGSGGVAQLSDIVIGLERNQQGDDNNQIRVRVLKNRYCGDLGVCEILEYDKSSGLLSNDVIVETKKAIDEECPF